MTLQLVIEQRRRDLGGFEVGRVLPLAKHRMIGPFIFFDHFGPAEFARGLPRSVDVRPHPHIGLSTVTYLFEGEIMHRDSVGSEQAVRPGEVNWMVAGRGITHSERFEKARAEGGPMHGIQAWVALPREDEETAPSFANYAGDGLPTIDDQGVWLRLVAGELHGVRAEAATHSPMFYAHSKPCTRRDDFFAERIHRACGFCRLRQRDGRRARVHQRTDAGICSPCAMRSFSPTRRRC